MCINLPLYCTICRKIQLMKSIGTNHSLHIKTLNFSLERPLPWVGMGLPVGCEVRMFASLRPLPWVLPPFSTLPLAFGCLVEQLYIF